MERGRDLYVSRSKLSSIDHSYRGSFLPRNDLPHLWISLRYEKLANVCYRCGVIGHETHACQGKAFLIWNPFGHEFIALGPWLRAENSTTLAELYHNPGNVT